MSDDLQLTGDANQTPPIRLITVHSQKGGVGKTMISLYIASRLAHELKEKTVLIDADLTGTSLTDVLRLKAPSTEGGYYSATETVKLLREMSKVSRKEAAWLDNPLPGPKMLNHFLFCNPWIYEQALKPDSVVAGNSFKLRDLLWIWEPYRNGSDEGRRPQEVSCLSIIPSSGFSGHLATCLPHVYKEDLTGYMEFRLTDLVWALWKEDWEEPCLNIVVDTSPVLAGISKAVFNLHGATQLRLAGTQSTEQPSLAHMALFVTSPDAQDLVAFARGIDELAATKALALSRDLRNPSQFEGLLAEELSLVINKVPRTTVTVPNTENVVGGFSMGAANELDAKGDQIPVGGVDREYFLDNPGQARKYCYDAIVELYEFESEMLRQNDAARSLFTGRQQAQVVHYDEQQAASMFFKGQASLSSLDGLTPVFNAVKGTKPRDALRRQKD